MPNIGRGEHRGCSRALSWHLSNYLYYSNPSYICHTYQSCQILQLILLTVNVIVLLLVQDKGRSMLRWHVIVKCIIYSNIEIIMFVLSDSSLEHSNVAFEIQNTELLGKEI